MSVFTDHYKKLVEHESDNVNEDEFITLKRVDHELEEELELMVEISIPFSPFSIFFFT